MSFQSPSVWFMICLPAINVRAMSNEDGASIGYIGCDIAHVLEMRRDMFACHKRSSNIK